MHQLGGAERIRRGISLSAPLSRAAHLVPLVHLARMRTAAMAVGVALLVSDASMVPASDTELAMADGYAGLGVGPDLGFGDQDDPGMEDEGFVDNDTAAPPLSSENLIALGVDVPDADASDLLPENPIPGAALQDSFGFPRSGGRTHKGIDIFAPEGTEIHAAMGGVVIKVRGPGELPEGALGGRSVTILGDDGRFYYYAHTSENLVLTGDRVATGNVIALVGRTGNAQNTAPHLHLGISVGGTDFSEENAVNPYPLLTGDDDYNGYDGEQAAPAPPAPSGSATTTTTDPSSSSTTDPTPTTADSSTSSATGSSATGSSATDPAELSSVVISSTTSSSSAATQPTTTRPTTTTTITTRRTTTTRVTTTTTRPTTTTRRTTTTTTRTRPTSTTRPTTTTTVPTTTSTTAPDCPAPPTTASTTTTSTTAPPTTTSTTTSTAPSSTGTTGQDQTTSTTTTTESTTTTASPDCSTTTTQPTTTTPCSTTITTTTTGEDETATTVDSQRTGSQTDLGSTTATASTSAPAPSDADQCETATTTSSGAD